MLLEGQVGKQVLATGAASKIRLAEDGSVAVRGGRGYGVIRNGNIFLAANSATQALSVNSVTATGIILTNPPTSGKILSLLRVSVALASLPAGQSALILSGGAGTLGSVTHTTPLTVRNALLGLGDAAVGLADSAATLPTGGNTSSAHLQQVQLPLWQPAQPSRLSLTPTSTAKSHCRQGPSSPCRP